jgi:predicted phage terminase large subunit-like protein
MRPEDAQALYFEAKRALLQRSFRDFVVWAWFLITGTPYVPNQITEQIIATLQRVGDGELWRVLICCPPGVGKSTVHACFKGWRTGRDPRHRSIHASHSFELARDLSLRVRRFVEGDAYRAMFPDVVLRDDQNTAGRWSTTRDGRFVAVGTDSGLTGVRAHEAVIDDGLSAADRFSPAKRESLWRWFLESLSTRLDGERAPIVVIAQRLDRDDLPGRLIEAGGWTLVELPAETEDGELLAPNVLPREKLDALKAQSAATYATQYLQRPNDDATANGAKRTWWRFHRAAHVAPTTPRPLGCDVDVPAVETPEHFSNVVIACDLTFGGLKAANDFASIQVWGANGAGRYLLAHWRRKATQLDQQEAIRNLSREYPGATIIVEAAAGGQGAVELLRAAGFTNVLGVTTGGKGKDQRFSLVSPTLESGCAYLPLGAAWLGDFVEELAGATKHDDAKDACAYGLARLALREHHAADCDGGWSGNEPVAITTSYDASSGDLSGGWGGNSEPDRIWMLPFSQGGSR